MKTFRRLLSALLVIVTLIGVIPIEPISAATTAEIEAADPNMLDNYVLDFMQWIGYNVNGQFDDEKMYDYYYTTNGYYGYTSKGNRLSYDTTGIPYNDSGSGNSGLGTVAQFKSQGLVCASYTAAYYLNYLVNVKGHFQEDDDGWSEMADAMYDAIMDNGSTQLANAWKLGMDELVAQFEADPNLTIGGYRIVRYKYEDGEAEEAYENMQIGDLVLFNYEGKCTHTGIYMGELGSASGNGWASYSPNGKNHWISNMVSKEKGLGPDILEVFAKAYDDDDTSKRGYPVYYHFEYVGPSTGSVKIIKKSNTGYNYGWNFLVTDPDGNEVGIYRTGSDGTLTIPGLVPGKYTIKEIPDTIVINSVVAVPTVASGSEATVTVNASGSGLTYQWYYRSSSTASWHKSSITTNEYSVEMSDSRDGRQVYCKITDSNGNVASTDITTLHVSDGNPKITKLTANPTGAPGETVSATVKASGSGLTYVWYYRKAGATKWSKSSVTTATYDMALNASRDNREVYCLVTDSSGNTVSSDIVTFKVVHDANYWTCTDSDLTQTVTVTADTTKSVTFTNNEYGKVKLIKKTNTGKNLSGWVITLYSDSACTTKVGSYTTGSDGTITIGNLAAGTYYAKETGSSDPYWVCDTSKKTVKVTAGSTASVTFTNNHYGKIKFVKTTNTGENLSGWVITLYSDSACTTKVGSYTTGSDGTITTGNLTAGTYYAKETGSSDPYWECDTSVKTVTVAVGTTATVTFGNTHYGALQINKTTNTGENYGWRFKVTDSDGNVVGTYRTNSSGVITVTDLLPGNYTVTEIEDTVTILGATVNTRVASGESPSVVLDVQGEGLTYKWYYKNASASKFSYTDTFTGNTYFISSMSSSRNGRQVYCVITDENGNSVTSDIYTFEMASDSPTINGITAVTSAENGGSISVKIDAEGDGLTYTWYYKNASASKFSKTSTFTGNTYATTMRYDRDGRQVYCVITDANGNTYTSPVFTFHVYHDAAYWEATTLSKSVTVNAGATATTSFTNTYTEPNAIIAVKKRNSLMAPVVGAVFGVYTDSACTDAYLVGIMTTDSSGEATLGGLEDGVTYYVKEISAPEGYILNSTVYSVVAAHGATTYINDGNAVINAMDTRIQIIKSDDLGNVLGEGYQFGIYYRTSLINNNALTLLQTITTNSEGVAVSGTIPNIPSASYYIKELAVGDDGHYLDGTLTPITLSLGATITVNFVNEIKRGSIAVLKVDDAGNTVEGVTFTVYSDESCTTSVGTITTGEDGEGLLEDLPHGYTYYVKETAAPENYVMDSTVYPVTIVGEATTYINDGDAVVNVQKGKIQITKINDLGTILGAGYEFGIYEDAECTFYLTSIITDDTGSGITEWLNPGTYYIKELVMGDDIHNKNNEILEIEVLPGETSETEFVNEIKRGSIAVLKVDDAGNAVENITFTVYSDRRCTTSVGTITTGEDGEGLLEELPHGYTYYVKETYAPENYVMDTTVYSVTIVGDATTYINDGDAVVNIRKGKIQITKLNDLGSVLGEGYAFGIYTDAECTTIVNGIVTDETGSTISGWLAPGTYYIKELAMGDDSHIQNTEIVEVDVLPGETTQIDFINNIKRGSLAVLKTDDAGSPMEGVTFTIYSDAACSTMVSTITTDENGEAVMDNLPHGYTYYVKETSVHEEYILDTTVYPVTVVGNETTYINGGNPVINVRKGKIQLTKMDDLGIVLGAGYQFSVYADEECTILVAGIITDETGSTISGWLAPGTYYIKELAMGDNYHYLNTNIIEVDVLPGETTQIDFINNIKRGSLAVLKTDEDGNALEGVIFTVYSDAACSTMVSTITTDENGEATLSDLPHGYTFYVVETTALEGYVLDTTVYPVSIVGDKVTYINGGKAVINYRLVDLNIVKVNTYDEPLEGVTFLLEWSQDGNNWDAVYSADKMAPVCGGCSSKELTNGCLTTGKDGKITFEGLYPGLKYRLTELETQDGYQLLTDYAFEGTLTCNSAPDALTVVNCPAYSLPPTGITANLATATIATAIAVLTLALAATVVFDLPIPLIRRRKKSSENK